MARYTIRVHHEDRTWWAEVDEIPGYSIAGPDVRSLLTDLADALVDGAGNPWPHDGPVR